MNSALEKEVINLRILRDKNFQKFMISYILVLFIPLTITIYSYFHATEIIENNVTQANVFNLENFRDAMDTRIAQIDRSVFDFSTNEDFRRILQLPFMSYNTPNMYWFKVARDEFNRFNFSSSMVDEDRSFLFLRGNNNVVYGRNFFSSHFYQFYGEHFQFGDKTGEEFWDFLFSYRYFSNFMPKEYVTFLDSSGYYIPYVFSLPATARIAGGDTERVWGTMVYLFNVEELLKLMAGSLDAYGGQTFLLYDGNVLASTADMYDGFYELNISTPRKISVERVVWNGSDALAIHIPSNYTQLSYLTLLPHNVIRADMNRLRNVVVTLFIIALLAGLAISAALSYRNTLPVTHLLSSNTDLQNQLKEQRQSMQALYLDKLLKNDFASVKDLQLSLSHVGLVFDQSGYRVILFRILPVGFIASGTHLQDWDVYQAFLQNCIAPEHQVHALNHNELAVIFSFKPDDDINEIIGAIQEEFNRQFGFIPICGIGEEYSNIEVHYSMQEALAAADYVADSTTGAQSHIIWYKDVTSKNTLEVFGKDQEQMLVNLVRQGDGDALCAHLDGLFAGTQYRGLSAGVKQLYLAHLHTVLMRMAADTKIDVDFKLLEKRATEKRDVYFLALREAYIQLCNQLRKAKKGRKQQLKESILAYINERFSNSGLSVAVLASHFNVAENYFSQFFSEQVGEPFSRYLERVRIEHAAKLLTEDATLTINDVALRSGYNSTNTFRNAFKRVMGTIPSEYVKV